MVVGTDSYPFSHIYIHSRNLALVVLPAILLKVLEGNFSDMAHVKTFFLVF
jgi:hypothetical protein